MTARRVPIWSRVVLGVLLPILAYNIWDYIESRRFESRLTAIRERGEPTTPPYHRPTGDADQAERFYRAASTLITDSKASIEIRSRVGKAWRDGQWTPDTLKAASAEVAENREALDYVDRAASLPFTGFPGGTSYNYLTGDLIRLARLCQLRAAVEMSEGKADTVLGTYYSEARLVRAIESEPTGVGIAFIPTFLGLGVAVSSGGRVPGRELLARAFADLDRDDRLKTALLTGRITMLNGRPPVWFGAALPPANPFVAHIAVRQLDAFAALISAADKPSPQRIEAVNAVSLWPFGFGGGGPQVSIALRDYTNTITNQVKRIRCARLLVSTTPLDLIDPFSGKRLEVSACRL